MLVPGHVDESKPQANQLGSKMLDQVFIMFYMKFAYILGNAHHRILIVSRPTGKPSDQFEII